MTEESLLADLSRLINTLDDGELRPTVRGLVYQRPYLADETWPILKLISEVHGEVLGVPLETSRGLPVSAYVTDAADLVRAGIPTAVYGPTEWTTTPDEHVLISDLEACARVYALTAARFTKQPLNGL
jgi:acetylornithine deacetylase/succinyl-diaminopimelate desuccinylase-like protein